MKQLYERALTSHFANMFSNLSIDDALIGRENLFSLKRHFETEHENVLSVMYVNPTKDIKSSFFQKGYRSKLV